MRKITFLLFLAAALGVFSGFDRSQSAQSRQIRIGPGNGPKLFESKFGEPSKSVRSSAADDFRIEGIRPIDENTGVAYTSDRLFRTGDDGRTWSELALPKEPAEKISFVVFDDALHGYVFLSGAEGALSLAETFDGGAGWTKNSVRLPESDFFEADFGKVSAEVLADKELLLTVRLPTSSNFTGRAVYRSAENRRAWRLQFRTVEIRRADEAAAETIDGKWTLKTDGSCAGAKTGCVQESRLFSGEREITPPAIGESARRAKEKAKLEVSNSIFAQTPGGATRISLHRGFDKCTAATAAQMQIWWNSSPFYDANIYISGRNRGCAQPQLSAAWVAQVSAQGWGLIPTIVGYQAPCSVSTNSAKHSSDPAVAEQQGRGEADIAVADAVNLGLTAGSVLYYDMERYDETAGTPGCRASVKAFLKGWTDRVKELGYISGVYGSPTNAVGDWISIPEASRMDAVWLARWDNIPSVWTYAAPSPVVPETVWANHQRIKQWQSPHNETWGGVTFNIDGNIADGPVAGAQPPKNEIADFDGDGKTDLSVWRPSSGVWYVLNSSDASFSINSFGLASDRLVPGDYDGDGKTDLAVWRADTGVWHLFSRSIYRSYQFGAAGDIPVPADYDGDRRTDFAVFRPSNGLWYIASSLDSRGTSFRIEQFGTGGDLPVTGDYDGDGKADLAVWRPGDGNWYLLRSRDGFTAANFGQAGDRPVQADYDGDGKTDLGIYRDGVWYLSQSQAGSVVTQFGTSGDAPSVGDYDGDDRADIAVFRPSTGVWYIQRSTGGFDIAQFGADGDRTVPAAYAPQN